MNWGMVMTDWKAREDSLDDLFAAARRAAPEPAPGLLARMMADAELAQEAAQAAALRRDVRPAPGGLMTTLRGMFGGWGALGGMATATLAGVWIGFAGVDQLGQVTGFFGTTESLGTVSLLPEGDIFALASQE